MSLFKIYLTLMLLFAISLGAYFLNMGALHNPISYTISVLKSLLIITFFMEVKSSAPLIRVAVWSGLLWLAILISLSLTDYLTRGISLQPPSG